MAFVFTTVIHINGTSGEFVVEAEFNNTSADGQIRTVRATNNDSVPHFCQALYQGAWVPSPAQQVDPGTVQSFTTSPSVKAGDVAAITAR